MRAATFKPFKYPTPTPAVRAGTRPTRAPLSCDLLALSGGDLPKTGSAAAAAGAGAAETEVAGADDGFGPEEAKGGDGGEASGAQGALHALLRL